jgi:hypothetical protein
MVRSAYFILISALALSTAAQAATTPKRHIHSSDVIIHTGPVIPPQTDAPVGSLNHYSYDTLAAQPPGLTSEMGKYGQSTLPRQFDPPGDGSPLFRF